MRRLAAFWTTSASLITKESLNGRTEVEELREALEHLQAASLEVSEELDAYQQRHAR
jgi:hypothetical protein